MRIICLENADSRLELLPSLGGGIKSYHYKNGATSYPILRDSQMPNSPGDSAYFPLVPFSNRIRNGRFFWQNKLVSLPLNFPPEKHALHGFGWQSEWQIENQSDEQVTLLYRNTCPDWRFDFEARQTFTLTESGINVQLQVQNLSDEQMPCGLGFHPYFTRTPDVEVFADVSKMWSVDEECLPTELVDVPFYNAEHPKWLIAEHELDNALLNPSGLASINWPEWGIAADIVSSGNCQFLVCYSPKNADFFCLEPVTNCTDAFNRYNEGAPETGLTVLPPFGILETQMAIKVRPI